MVPLSIHSLKSTGQQHMLWKEKLWGEEKACSKRGEGEKWRKDEGRETKGRALQKVMLTGFEISSGKALVGFSTSQYCWDSNLTAVSALETQALREQN